VSSRRGAHNAAVGCGTLRHGKGDDPVADYEAHELLSLHELLMGTALHAKEVKAHLPQIRDPELRRIAENCLTAKERFVQQVEQVLKA
jgi:hypothetical protein